jgi:pimeloyl-ACP methyl ester carboxylesterase
MLAASRRLTSVCFLLAAVAGCSVARIERGAGPTLGAAIRSSAPTDSSLSIRTLHELYRLDLYRLYPDHLDDLAARLHAEAVNEARPELLFALAEVNLLRGRNLEKANDPRASICYFRSAGYAWHFLFGDSAAAGRPIAAFDPRFRLACDLYNTSLARCLVLALTWQQLDARGEWHLPGRDSQDAPVRLDVAHVGFLWKPEEFGPMALCSAYRPVGMGTMQRTYGLGVPLVAQRAENGRPHAFVPAEITFPVTAFCRFGGPLADLTERPRARLEFLNPLVVTAAKVGEHSVPLESDLTTPLAHYLGQEYIEQAGYLSFFKPAILGDLAGLHFLEPYQPGKIPVILIHGLLSSPQTFAPVVNELLADPEVRRRFRFGVFFYPTGEPYVSTAADLRRDLAAYRRSVDPWGRDPALSEVVVVGHSMGGLIARLLTVDGGDDFWQADSDVPLAQLKLSAQAHEQLRRLYYFQRDPGVTRVVFCGTPHRGSCLSPALPGRLANLFAGLPRPLLRMASEVEQLNPQVRVTHGRPPTSVELLSPDAPTLRVLEGRRRPEGVTYHSIVGVALTPEMAAQKCWGKGAGDGVVPYDSAHLEGVRSELVVQADHTHVHQHPLAIRELRRILREHAVEFARKRAAAPRAATASPPGGR